MDKLVYESFIRRAFSLQEGSTEGRDGDPAALANADQFSDANIYKVKAAVGYAMCIFNNFICERYEVSKEDLEKMEHLLKAVVNAGEGNIDKSVVNPGGGNIDKSIVSTGGGSIDKSVVNPGGGNIDKSIVSKGGGSIDKVVAAGGANLIQELIEEYSNTIEHKYIR